ncbi:glycosyltransferase [Paraburkholderia sp. J67]|uniref:O-linked N-acetylglucosamine transferase family protein n=1 Tax=Paraburkholderia sp. J67 TaxID=2805435 RepID=UPI002ABE1768|nr:glycosyltransferase [Paraburkholderia sp. J67]
MTAFSTPTEAIASAPQVPAKHDIELVMHTAIEHHRKQEYDEAAALYSAVLAAVSDHIDANYHLAVLRLQTDQPAEAVPHLEVVLGHTPKNGQVWVYYISALVASQQPEAARAALEVARQQGLPEDAVRTLQARINGEEEPSPAVAEPEVAPAPEPAPPAKASGDDAPAPEAPEADQRLKLDTRRASAKEQRQYQHLFNSGKLEAALKVARRLTQHYPSHGECWIELGRVLQATGHYSEAVEAAEQAARLLPNHIGAQTVLADRLIVTRQHQRAKEHCLQALERYPESAALHRNLGSALLELSSPDEGFVHMHRAVELAPNSAVEFDALATALGRHGLYEEAEAAFRRALELMPMQSTTHSNLLFYLMHKPGLDAASAFAEFREFATRHEAALRDRRPRHTNDRDPARRLKVGFVSGDLINHPVAYFFLSVLEHLVRDTSLSLHIYSNYAITDAFTSQIRQHAHTWTEIFGMTNDVVTQKIRDDGIDILIDLSGHTGRNRLLVFAQRPAPVQASWIGNPATTGLDAMGYYLSDRFVTPLEQFESRFSEKLVFLPALAPFKPHPQSPAVNELPALKNGYLTFGSFSRIVKISQEVVGLWARVLREVPNSRMLIGAIAAKDQMIKLTEMFVKEGTDISRISFLGRANVTVYLQQHNLIDVCLDTFPFGNSTTTMQALWMGVPTMTLPGDSMASRSSTGWLSHLGLDAAFVAQDKDDFVHKCAALAADPEALAAVRRELRGHCRQSALIDASGIANAASRAFRIMWQRWCDGLEPEHFEVLAQSASQAASDPLAVRNMDGAPFFSIVIPTHNRATLLRRALESVNSQQGGIPFEILVIADTDDPATDAVCLEMLGEADSYLRREGKPGPSESRNLALDHVKGKYVLFLDDDDTFHPGLFEKLYAHALVQQENLVYFDGSIVQERRYPHTETLSEHTLDMSARLTADVFTKNQLPFSCYAFPTRLLKDIRFDTYMRAYEDWEFLLAVFERQMPKHVPVLGPRVHQVPEGPSDRRSTSRAATDMNAALDYLYVYRRRPAPSPEQKEKRAAFLHAICGFSIPASMF